MSKGSGSPRNSGGRKQNDNIDTIQKRVDDLLNYTFDPTDRGSVSKYVNDAEELISAQSKAYGKLEDNLRKELDGETDRSRRLELLTQINQTSAYNQRNTGLLRANMDMLEVAETDIRAMRTRLDRGEITKDEYDRMRKSYFDRKRKDIRNSSPYNF